MKRKIFCGFLLLSCFVLVMTGCMAALEYAGRGLVGAEQTVQVAQGLLSALDELYDKLLSLRDNRVNNMTVDKSVQQSATRALAVADTTATEIKQVLAGKQIDDAKLNALVGQVDGIKALTDGIFSTDLEVGAKIAATDCPQRPQRLGERKK